jgi:hypothetical protein
VRGGYTRRRFCAPGRPFRCFAASGAVPRGPSLPTLFHDRGGTREHRRVADPRLPVGARRPFDMESLLVKNSNTILTVTALAKYSHGLTNRALSVGYSDSGFARHVAVRGKCECYLTILGVEPSTANAMAIA